MQLRLRTKLTLVMTGLVFLVVVVLSAVFMARLTSQVIHETNTRANELSQQIFEQAKHALEDAKQAGMLPLGIEGQREAEWVLVDLGDIVVHVMLPRIREFYGLERLWTVGDREPDSQAVGAG